MPALSGYNKDPVLYQRDLTDVSADALFLAKEIPEKDLSPLGADMIHRLQEELLFIVVQNIGLEIAHGCLLKYWM